MSPSELGFEEDVREQASRVFRKYMKRIEGYVGERCLICCWSVVGDCYAPLVGASFYARCGYSDCAHNFGTNNDCHKFEVRVDC